MWDLDEDSFITLTDENGNEVDFLLLDVMEYAGADYMVLLPITDEDTDEEDEHLFFLRAERTEEGEIYSAIEDESLLNAIAAAYEKDLNERVHQSSIEAREAETEE